MSKLNAFLAAIPANGLPSPTISKTSTAPPNKAFPSLAIPQEDPDDDDDDDGLSTRKVPQPATPQPQFTRHKAPSRVRDIARKLESPRAFDFESPPSSGDPANGCNSNQEDVDDRKIALPPLSPVAPQASTPIKHRAKGHVRVRRSLEDEAGPLKRLSVTHQLQQQQQQQGQHHRRVSTDTATFSKMLKKQPHEDIDNSVVQFFSTLPVPTVSRPEQGSNQVEEDVATPSDPSELLAVFKRGETISVAAALAILQQATDAMALEPNVVQLRAPFTVVGDLHGQFSDLVELFRVHGSPSPTNPFLFLGDYVDRGVSSCEIILLLLAYKLRFPKHIFLLRGNHECRSLSTFYGFRAECLKKYGLAVYNRTIKCFESMPLAATIETARGTFLAVHGGLSPSIQRVDEINDKIDRFMEPDPSGALCDLLWADPAKDPHGQDEPFAPNSVRGCSYTFNEQVCREFLARNGLLAIIRAHELEEDGFREHFIAEEHDDEAESKLAPVITVFSAPEYCNTNHNMGATLLIPWAPQSATDKPLEYRQHTRSAQREVEFAGASEFDAVRKFLGEQLPFLPVDFYELVVVCRQLQATLDVAASIATPVVSSASNVIPEKSAVGSELAVVVGEDERRSLDRTSTQGETPAAVAAVTPTPPQPLPHTVHIRTTKPRRRASTGSGLRLCPGFVRFCEKYLGLHFHESTPRPTCIITPKKRRSIDDISVGTSSTPATETVRPADVAEIQLLPPISITVPKPSTLPKNNLEIFTTAQWSALRLYFSLLDVNGTGVLMEESFVVLLAEQDSDAYATQEELQLLMDVVDGNDDGLITIQDFLQFAYRAFLRWKKNSTPRRSSKA